MRGTLFISIIAFFLTSCGDGTDPADEAAARLPLVTAPIDTLKEIQAEPDSNMIEADGDERLQRPSWTSAELAGYPPPSRLVFSRYRNEQYGYSVAYPDTLLRQTAPVGEGRGMEFTSSLGGVGMLVYAMEGRSYEDMDEQYEDILEDPALDVTYRARDENFYIVAGRQGEASFYEKAVSAQGRVITLRLEYPAERRAYFDAVTALIAASLEDL